MSALFGGSKSKSVSQSTQSSQSTSSSGNQAYNNLSNLYTPAISQGNQAMSSVAALLGQSGDQAAAQGAFNNYLGSTDYNFTMGQGTKALTNAAAVNGSLGSGATLKALQGFGQGTAQKYFGDYISRLLGVGQYGLSSGGLISGAGGFSNSTSTSTGQSTGNSSSSSQEGLAKTLGAAASLAAASDRRLKKDIVLLDRLSDGLGVYEWEYIWGDGRIQGHMADEVKELRPWAMGPTIGGYMTVDYARI